MPESPINPTASEEKNILGPDYFGFYTHEVKRLLSQDDGVLPFGHLDGVGRQNGSTKNSYQTKINNDIIGSDTLSSSSIGATLSEPKKERLKALLRQSVRTLTLEVDEMINPVLNVCRLRSCLRCKESLLKLDASTCKTNAQKQKSLSDCSSPCITKKSRTGSSGIEGGEENEELNDDLRFILKHDSYKVEELMRSHTSEINSTLCYMEQNLEEFLNIVMTTCRAMTIVEKQQLCRAIYNLPSGNLGRVTEIIEFSTPMEQISSNELCVDLENLDDVTLWRLYFYVAAVKANSTE